MKRAYTERKDSLMIITPPVATPRMTTYNTWENNKKNRAACTTAPHYWEIENKDAIVIPSLSFDTHELQSISGIGHYEGKTKKS